jgi:hypothetical protein
MTRDADQSRIATVLAEFVLEPDPSRTPKGIKIPFQNFTSPLRALSFLRPAVIFTDPLDCSAGRRGLRELRSFSQGQKNHMVLILQPD